VYVKSEKGNSWARSQISDNLFCMQASSKGSENEVCKLSNTPTPSSSISIIPTLSLLSPTILISLSATPTYSPTPTTALSSFDNIYLSEVMVAPLANQKEWVEIYNGGDKSIKLENWYIDDEEDKGSTPKKFTADIPAKGYYFYVLSSGIFNNNKDHVRLITSSGEEKERFVYSSSQSGKTWGRQSTENDVFCLQEASPGMMNTDCISNEKLSDENNDTDINNSTETSSVTGRLSTVEESKDNDSKLDLSSRSFSNSNEIGVTSMKSARSLITNQDIPRYQDTLAMGNPISSGEAFFENNQDNEGGREIILSGLPAEKSESMSTYIVRISSIISVMMSVIVFFSRIITSDIFLKQYQRFMSQTV